MERQSSHIAAGAAADLDRGLLAEGLRNIVGRRGFVRGASVTAAGIAAAALLGCGDDEGGEEAKAPASSASPAAQKYPGITLGDGRFFGFNFDEPKTQPKRGGRVKFLYTFDPGQLDPRKTAAGGSHTAINATHNRLIGIYGGPDADPLVVNKLQPELAQSWERSPDGLTYTFKIQRGVKFQNLPPLNGREFVARDVVFAYEAYKSESVHTQLFEAVDRIEARDDYTAVITLKRPSPDFHLGLSTAHISIFPHELVDSGEIDKKAIGTGPMILKKWQPSVGGEMDKNPAYWKKEVLVDGWDLPYIADQAARTAAFRAGQVDYGHAISSQVELDTIIKSNPGTQILISPIFATTFTIAMNMQNPKYADERIRRAISLAVDRATLGRLIHADLAKFIPVMDWRFAGLKKEPSVEGGELGKWWRFDQKEAKSLLQAAGAENFAMNMVFYNYSDDGNSRPNEILVDQLRQVGIQLTAQRLEYTQFNSQWTTRKVEDAADGWLSHGATGEHVIYGLNHSKSSANRWRISDPTIDEWADAYRSELNEQRRNELGRRVWDRMLDKVYRIEKPSGYSFSLMQPWLRGVRTGRAIGSGQYYLDTAELTTHMWLDK